MNIFNQSFSGISNSANIEEINYSSIFVMILSMAVASTCNVFPLDHTLASLRPLFIFVIMLFWVVHKPEIFGIFFVFFVGLISDFLLDTRLGQQAFSAVLATFILQYLTKNKNRINDLELWLYATVSIVAFSLCLLILQFFDGQVVIWRNGLPMITSICIWPVVVFFLKRF